MSGRLAPTSVNLRDSFFEGCGLQLDFLVTTEARVGIGSTTVGLESTTDFSPHWGDVGETPMWIVVPARRSNEIPYIGKIDTVGLKFVDCPGYPARASISGPAYRAFRPESAAGLLFLGQHVSEVLSYYCEDITVSDVHLRDCFSNAVQIGAETVGSCKEVNINRLRVDYVNPAIYANDDGVTIGEHPGMRQSNINIVESDINLPTADATSKGITASLIDSEPDSLPRCENNRITADTLHEFIERSGSTDITNLANPSARRAMNVKSAVAVVDLLALEQAATFEANALTLKGTLSVKAAPLDPTVVMTIVMPMAGSSVEAVCVFRNSSPDYSYRFTHNNNKIRCPDATNFVLGPNESMLVTRVSNSVVQIVGTAV